MDIEYLDRHYKLYKSAWTYCGDIREERFLEKDEVSYLLRKGGLLVRNLYGFDCGEPTSFWYLVKDRENMTELGGHTTRRRVQKALSLLRYEMVPVSQFPVLEAYEVMKKNHNFYKVKSVCPSWDSFKQRFFGMNEEFYDLWTARSKETNQLVAWAVKYRNVEYCDYRTIKADPAFFQSHFPFYGFYSVCNEYYLSQRGMCFVTIGSRSITEHSNIEAFLTEKFKFRKAYCHIRVYYKWWLSLLVKSFFPFRSLIPRNCALRAILNMEEMQRKDKYAE